MSSACKSQTMSDLQRMKLTFLSCKVSQVTQEKITIQFGIRWNPTQLKLMMKTLLIIYVLILSSKETLVFGGGSQICVVTTGIPHYCNKRRCIVINSSAYLCWVSVSFTCGIICSRHWGLPWFLCPGFPDLPPGGCLILCLTIRVRCNHRDSW